MIRAISAIASTRVHLSAAIRALVAELARLNRFGIEDGSRAGRRERARMVVAELARRYRSPNRCC